MTGTIVDWLSFVVVIQVFVVNPELVTPSVEKPDGGIVTVAVTMLPVIALVVVPETVGGVF